MRKRSIIAGVFALAILILTNDFWLNKKAVDVKLDLNNIRKSTIQVQLSNKNFKSDIVKKEIDSKKSDLKLKVGNILTFDKLKITVNSEIPGDSNLVNAENTKVRGGKYKVKGCKTEVLPDNSIEYLCNVKGRASFNFEFEIFIIILILSYLLSYKLIDYLADFKTIKEKSRIEIIFLAVFFVCLYLPMSNIDTSDISKSENRKLAKWQPLITKDYKINYNFGKSFDNWYNDRFFLRNKVVLSAPQTYSKINHPKVLFGKDGWLFYKGNGSVDNYLNKKKFSEKELEQITNYLVSIDNYCKKHNKKFYFIIAPDKNKIYGEYYPAYIHKHIDNSQSRANQLISYIHEHSDIKVVYPYDELMKNKHRGLLYLKKNTHWNHMGAYIAYELLMKQIKKDFRDINFVKIYEYAKEKTPGDDLNGMLSYKIPTDDTLYIKPVVDINYKIVGVDSSSHGNLYSSKKIKAPHVIVYRDSFTTALIPYISNTFSQVNYYWRPDVKVNEIKDCDIIILEKVERYLPVFLKYKSIVGE